MLEKCFQCCDRRDLETFPKPGKNEAGAAKAAFSTGCPPELPVVCGVGINFRSDNTGALFVSSIVPEGPAFKNGGVLVGDTLYEVDGVIVHRSTLSLVTKHLLGPSGSVAKVVFLRAGNKVLVQIPRGVVPSLMRIQRPNLPASDAPSYGQCGGLGEMLHSPKARPPSGQTMPATEYF